ncbi:hypothetical protein [Methylobacterium soli]|nr:hypothetical protein [Methylobacterium soli]GJE42751.1 hypothetical protein AEGHOMDF_1924 [Methylobacterium soli]
MAVVIVYGLLNTFVFLRGRPLQERVLPAAAVFLLTLMFAGAFVS